jgi:hypothetical protein
LGRGKVTGVRFNPAEQFERLGGGCHGCQGWGLGGAGAAEL